MIMREKLLFGFMSPVISSTVSIYLQVWCQYLVCALRCLFFPSSFVFFSYLLARLSCSPVVRGYSILLPSSFLLIPTLYPHPNPSLGDKETNRKLTCIRTLSITRSTSSVGYGDNSGAVRSLTHARVNACKSSVRCGTRGALTEARMSSMSIYAGSFSQFDVGQGSGFPLGKRGISLISLFAVWFLISA